jgi:hypothetical protein
MLGRISIGAMAAAAALSMTIGAAQALDESKYPDFSSQWIRIGGVQWDPSKPQSRGQGAPLTPEYQAIFDASLAAKPRAGTAMICGSPAERRACRGS